MSQTELTGKARRTALAAPLARPRALSGARLGGLTPYLYLAPALAIYLAFFIYPLGHLILLSFQRWDGVRPRVWVGLDNYRQLFGDQVFWMAAGHNLYWLLAAVIVPVFLGLTLAILLYRSPLRGKAVFRAVYFVPQILSSVVVALIWNWIYNPNYGALNRLLESFGLGVLRRGWLGEANLALPSLFIAWSWIHYGFTMVIFIAALQGIDETYFDAAKVDGANWWQQFRHILVPFIQGPLTTVVLITAIGSFQVFDIVFVLTNGGPANRTMIMAIWMYQNAFRFNKVGYGAAIAVLLGLVILLLSILFLRVRGTFSNEETQ